MPSAEFFRKLGFYTVRNFLDRDFCAEVCQEMQNATPIKGTIGVKNEEAVNENFKRRVEMEDISSEITDKLREKLRMAIPDLEEFYSVRLFDVQPPKFIEYRPGDFYKPHTDFMDDLGGLVKEGERAPKYRGIVYLNDESNEAFEGAYCGGNLTFHGLLGDSAFASYGFPLVGECGLLVTFPPDVLHEVTPVTYGNRYSIASWYV